MINGKFLCVILFFSLTFFFSLLCLTTGHHVASVILSVICIEFGNYAIIKPAYAKLEHFNVRRNYRRK